MNILFCANSATPRLAHFRESRTHWPHSVSSLYCWRTSAVSKGFTAYKIDVNGMPRHLNVNDNHLGSRCLGPYRYLFRNYRIALSDSMARHAKVSIRRRHCGRTCPLKYHFVALDTRQTPHAGAIQPRMHLWSTNSRRYGRLWLAADDKDGH